MLPGEARRGPDRRFGSVQVEVVELEHRVDQEGSPPGVRLAGAAQDIGVVIHRRQVMAAQRVADPARRTPRR